LGGGVLSVRGTGSSGDSYEKKSNSKLVEFHYNLNQSMKEWILKKKKKKKKKKSKNELNSK